MMFFDDFFGDTFSVTYKIYLGTKLIQTMTQTAPRVLLENQFLQLCQQAVAQLGSPVKVIMSREETIFDQFDQKEKVVPYTLEFRNYYEEDNV